MQGGTDEGAQKRETVIDPLRSCSLGDGAIRRLWNGKDGVGEMPGEEEVWGEG